MIDRQERNIEAGVPPLGLVPGSIIKVDEGEHEELDDDQLLSCDSQLHAFSLTVKRWGLFRVDGVRDVDFDANAFESLVLSEDKKSMISSLVKTSQGEQESFNDLIKGKGKGIIFLLHGPPGVGKTFTAGSIHSSTRACKGMANCIVESIAEHTRRPLYSISCGDLGVDRPTVEQNLRAALSRATKWNAVTLIDEADVFMQERSLNDLERNELVSGSAVRRSRDEC
jgi:hypothetical protein